MCVYVCVYYIIYIDMSSAKQSYQFGKLYTKSLQTNKLILVIF